METWEQTINRDCFQVKQFLRLVWLSPDRIHPILCSTSRHELDHLNLHTSLKLFPSTIVIEAHLSSLLLWGLQPRSCVISSSLFVGLISQVNTHVTIFSRAFLLQPELISTFFSSLLHVLWNIQNSDLVMLLQWANYLELIDQCQMYHCWSRLKGVYSKLIPLRKEMFGGLRTLICDPLQLLLIRF